MDVLFLNFPTFYHSAIKNNTSLPQFNAVSVLLLGDVRENCTEESIDDPSVSGYVSGKKPIRKSILTPLLNISHEEIVRRLHMLGIQDIQRMVDALTILIGEIPNLSGAAKAPLLVLAKTVGAEFDFVAEVFIAAIKCPTVFTHRLSSEMIQHLNSLGWPKQFTFIPNSSDSSEVVQEAVLNSDDISKLGIQKESVQTPSSFLQAAKEVTISYLSLSIPEDKEAAISYFLGTRSSAITLLNVDDADVESIISETDGFHYFMVELKGTWQSVVVEFSRWKKLPNCLGCILELEVPSDMGLDSMEEIASSIQNLIHEDANFIFGAKYVPEFPADQVHICTIFQMQDVLSESSSAPKGKDLDSSKLHSIIGGESVEDPFDDISRIFNKRVSKPEEELAEDPFDALFRIFNKRS